MFEEKIRAMPVSVALFFDGSDTYENFLKNRKEEFNRKWEENVPAPYSGLDDFEILNILGAGNFGQVILTRTKETDQYIAVKCILKEHVVKQKQVKHVYNEKRVLQSVDFPFLLQLEFSRKDNDYLYLGLPFVLGGELFTYHRKLRKFNEKQTIFYAAQVFLSFEYLHNLDVIYRDLKPENILIDRTGYIKITDFGFAKRVENRTFTLCGTPEYLAPEIIQSKPYNTCVDWWAFGVLIYELVAGKSPFAMYSKDHMVMYAQICQGNYKIPAYFSTDLKNLIENLLQVDVLRRYGSLVNGNQDIKNHEWFKNVEWISILNKKVNPPYVPKIRDLGDTSHYDPQPKATLVKSKTNKYAEHFLDF